MTLVKSLQYFLRLMRTQVVTKVDKLAAGASLRLSGLLLASLNLLVNEKKVETLLTNKEKCALGTPLTLSSHPSSALTGRNTYILI